MSQKVKVIVSVLVAVVLLTVGGATAVMAQGKPTPTPEVSTKGRLATGVEPQIELSKFFGYVGDNMTAGLLARVAEKLGISEEELANAFKQAQQEMRAEAATRWLDKAVEKGRLTQDEADAIKGWWEERPEVLDSGQLPGGFGLPALRGGHMGGGYKFMAPWGRHMGGGHRGWGSDNTTRLAD